MARLDSVRAVIWRAGFVMRASVLAGLLDIAAGQAGELMVPNASFELPATPFVNVDVAAWQEAPKPPWFDENGGFLWEQLTGVFRNTPPGAADHIDNMDGNQGIWLFARPDVALFQDYETVGGGGSEPSHEFDVKFEVGRAYRLTVGLIGGGGNMNEGATLEVRLYHRDPNGQRLTVATTPVVHSLAVFPTRTRLVDFQVKVPPVRAGDAWAGKNVGIEFRSVVGFDLEGGFWDLDHVRLETLDAPVLTHARVAGGQIRFDVKGVAGTRCEVLASPELAVPESEWTVVQTLDLPTGEAEFAETVMTAGRRFYRARMLL
jgi:hypothetical protein